MRFNLVGIELLFAFCITLFVSLQTAQTLKYEYVTWSSVVKLINTNSNSRLHSHDVKYGSGSGQQSVTAVKNADDHNSYWQVLPALGVKNIERGEKVRCGTTIRLLHLATRRNLHSHLFHSPLSNNQEVSAFGENGNGDEGDNWIIDCDDDFWRRDEPVRIQHKLTNKFLHVNGDQYGRPIAGQLEVSAYNYRNAYNLWKVEAGVYIKPVEPAHEYHSEL